MVAGLIDEDLAEPKFWQEMTRRGHPPTGLKEQLARRLVRDSSASADSIRRLAAIMAGNGGGRDSFPLEVLESEQSLTEWLEDRETS